MTSPVPSNGNDHTMKEGNGDELITLSLADRTRKVQLHGETLYPVGPTSSSSPKLGGKTENGSGSYTNGKGKQREGLHERGTMDGMGAGTGKGGKEVVRPVKREEVVRLMLQTLRDVGYSQAAEVLEVESGYIQEPPLASSFRQAILGGRWDESIQLLSDLGVVVSEDNTPLKRKDSRKSLNGGAGGSIAGTSSDSRSQETVPQNGRDDGKEQDTPGRKAIFMILRQKYLELLELGQVNRALKVLRFEMAPVAPDANKLHALSGLMMCSKKDIPQKAEWDGAAGESRQELLDGLQEFLPVGIIMPPRRLATLLDQARRHQEASCPYHTGTSSESLLSDHKCRREVFPTVTTHVLAEHTNEVWWIEWSPDGRYLASGGKDCHVIIWKIDPTPTRTCEKHLTLKGHSHAVTGIAWSPDGTRLVSAAESTLIMWDTATGAQLTNLPTSHQDTISQIRWISDQAGFVTSAMDQRIIFWNRQGRMKATWQTGPMRLLDFAITPDRKRMIGIASVSGRSAGRNANVEPAASRMPEPGLAALTPSRRNEDFSAAIDWPVYSIGTMEKHIVVYDLADGSQLAQTTYPGDLSSIGLSEDGKQAVIGLVNNEVQLWNVERNIPYLIRKYTGHTNRDFHLKSCLGGRNKNCVVSGSEDYRVYMWHKDTTKLLEVLEGHAGCVNAVTWNPVYPDIFASCSDDATIRLWQPTSVAEQLANTSNATMPWPPNGSAEPPQLSPMGLPMMGIDMDLVF